MKKIQKVAIFVCAILVSCLAACNKTETQEIKETNSVSTTSIVSKETILSKIKEANTIDSIYEALQSGKSGFRVLFSQQVFDIDNSFESSVSVLVYKDTDMHIILSSNSESGNKVIYTGDSKQIFYELDKDTMLLVGDVYKPVLQNMILNGDNDCVWNEKVIDFKETGDRIVVDTESKDHCCLESICQDYGYTIDDVDKKTTHYEVDSKTYEIYKITYTLYFKDGSSAEIYLTERTENYEKYLPSSDDMFDIEKLEKHTLTLIENPGTPEEIKHLYSVPVDWSWSTACSEEYDQTIYADPEFKNKLNKEKLTKDLTGYIRKKDKN